MKLRHNSSKEQSNRFINLCASKEKIYTITQNQYNKAMKHVEKHNRYERYRKEKLNKIYNDIYCTFQPYLYTRKRFAGQGVVGMMEDKASQEHSVERLTCRGQVNVAKTQRRFIYREVETVLKYCGTKDRYRTDVWDNSRWRSEQYSAGRKQRSYKAGSSISMSTVQSQNSPTMPHRIGK